jgi:hypothetical protein
MMRPLSLAGLGCLALIGCSDDVTTVTPGLLILGPGGFAVSNDNPEPETMILQSYLGTDYTTSESSPYSSLGFAFPAVDSSGNAWISAEGLDAEGATLWSGGSALFYAGGKRVSKPVPLFVAPPESFIPAYTITFGEPDAPLPFPSTLAAGAEPTASDLLFADAAERAGATFTDLGGARGYLIVGGTSIAGEADRVGGSIFGEPSDTIEWYDPYTGAFKLVLEAGCTFEDDPLECALRLEQGRAFHTATLLDDGRVMIAGGLVKRRSGTEVLGATASVEVIRLRADGTGSFDPAGAPTELIEPRAFHTASTLAEGDVIIVGGFSGVLGDPKPFPTDIEQLRPDNRGEFVTAAVALPVGRAMHTATSITDFGHGILIAGGRNETEVVSEGAILYRLADDTELSRDPWSVGSCAQRSPLCRWGHVAVLYRCPEADGPRVLLVGGFQSIETGNLFSASTGANVPAVFDSAWVIAGGSPVQAEWSYPLTGLTGTAISTAGFATGVSFGIGGDVLVAGGLGSNGQPVSNGYRFDMVREGEGGERCEITAVRPANLRTPRAFASSLVTTGQFAFVAGGADADASTPLRSSEWYNPDVYKLAKKR